MALRACPVLPRRESVGPLEAFQWRNLCYTKGLICLICDSQELSDGSQVLSANLSLCCVRKNVLGVVPFLTVHRDSRVWSSLPGVLVGQRRGLTGVGTSSCVMGIWAPCKEIPVAAGTEVSLTHWFSVG